MSKEVPDHEDAKLLLKVYDLRRESVLRESRKAILGGFWPKTFEDVHAVHQPDHPLNTAYRQVVGYWEMVYGIVRHGIVHADYFMETNGEGLFLFARVAPHLTRIRAELFPVGFRHAEWVSRECAEGRRIFDMFTARVKAILEKK